VLSGRPTARARRPVRRWRLSASAGDDLEGKRLGQEEGFVAEANADLAVDDVHVDVVDSQSANRCWPLGIQQDKQSGEPFFGFDGGVVQQRSSLFAPCLGVEGAGGTTPPHGGCVESAVFLACRQAVEDLVGRCVADSPSRSPRL
jgi:hypothetical protein